MFALRRGRGRIGIMWFVVAILMLQVSMAFAAGVAEEEAVAPEADREAPMLASLVAEGELPPVDERLPSNPKVVEPRDEIGRYGGEARSIMHGTGPWFTRTILYEGLVVWDPGWTEPIPGAAAEFDISDDATQFTFTLRDGLRWHDGEPFTTADIEWWYEYEIRNQRLNPTPPGRFVAGGQLASLEVIDELTFRFTFVEPNPLFLDELAGPVPWVPTAKHYAMQFHADFNEDIEDTARDEGFDTWYGYYDYMVMDAPEHWNAEVPTINPWTVVDGQGWTGEATVVRFERNPYYYRVDSAGNQLPYIDYWSYDVIDDSEAMLLRTMAGEVDLFSQVINTTENRPVLFENRERGDYHLYERVHTGCHMSIKLNMTHDDPTVREIAQNRDFRIGLSYAIDREEISEIVFAGQTRPRQPGPVEAMPFYHERLISQYLDFDQDLANEYFDRAEYELDDRGRRIGPDGNPIVIMVDVTDGQAEQIAQLELIREQWRAVGVELNLNVISRSLSVERFASNQHEAHVWGAGAAERDLLHDTRDIFPSGVEATYAPRWVAWYGAEYGLGANVHMILDRGVEPEEPPEPVRRQMELYVELLRSTPDRHADLMLEILDIAAEQFYAIGTVSNPPAYGIVHNRIGNPPRSTPAAWMYPDPGPTVLAQLFIRE